MLIFRAICIWYSLCTLKKVLYAEKSFADKRQRTKEIQTKEVEKEWGLGGGGRRRDKTTKRTHTHRQAQYAIDNFVCCASNECIQMKGRSF